MIKIKNKKKLPFFEFVYIFLFFAVFFLISFLLFTIVGIGFLSFLGFEYNSVSSVIFFFLIYFFVTRPIDFLCTTILDMARYVNRLPYPAYKFFEFMLDFILTVLVMGIIDVFMKSINIPLRTEVLFAILSYLLSESMDFFNKDNSKNYSR